MIKFFSRPFIAIFMNAIALYIVAQLFDSFYLNGFGTALFASLILSIFNLFVKPMFIILTLPLTIVTFGLFLFVINAIILMLTQSVMGDSFIIDSFATALLASIIIAIINVILTKILNPKTF